MSQNIKQINLFKNLNIKGILSVIGIFLNITTVGTMYLWGTIQIYIISYIRSEGQKEITLSVGGIIFPFMMTFMSLGMFFGVPMVQWIKSSKKLYFIISILIPGLYIWSSFSKNFYLFIFVYGVLNGLVLGILYISSLFIGFQHFPNHKGKVSGFTLIGQGVGQLVYSIFAQKYLNPDELVPSKLDGDQFKYFQGESIHVAEKVPEFLQLMALLIFVQLTLTNLFLIDLPQDLSQNLQQKEIRKKGLRMMWINILNEERYQIKSQQQLSTCQKLVSQNQLDQVEQSVEKVQKQIEKIYNNNQLPRHKVPYLKGDYDLEIQWEKEYEFLHLEKTHILEQYPNQCPAKKYVFQSWIFYYAILIGVNAAGPGLFLNAQYKNYYIQILNDEAFILLVGLVNSLGNGLLRFFWGIIFDIYQPKQILLFISLLNALIFATIDVASQNKFIFLVYNFIVMGLFGGCLSLLPVLFSKLFGIDMGSKIFGFMWIGLSMGNFLQYLLVQFLEPVIKFKGIFWIYFAISTFNFIALLFIPLKYDWSNKIKLYHQSQKQKFLKLYQ